MGKDVIPVIIDTDIGDDIDDAFALCLAMKSPELKLLGVTTVFKDTVRRARMAAAILRLGGFGEIPVVPGCGIPINNPYKFGQKQDFQEKPWTYIDELDSEYVDMKQDAVGFIIDTIKKSTTPITIITLGALTNIAHVFKQYPKAVDKIDRIVMMGGAYLMNFMENNIACDPEAAQEVLDSGVKILGVGIDVTLKCKLDGKCIAKLEAHPHPCIKLLMKMRRNWNHDIYLHDPLAVAAVFKDTLVKTEKRRYAVELSGQYSRSMTVHLSDHNWQYDPSDSNMEVCTDVDSESFIDLYMERVLSFQTIK